MMDSNHDFLVDHDELNIGIIELLSQKADFVGMISKSESVDIFMLID